MDHVLFVRKMPSFFGGGYTIMAGRVLEDRGETVLIRFLHFEEEIHKGRAFPIQGEGLHFGRLFNVHIGGAYRDDFPVALERKEPSLSSCVDVIDAKLEEKKEESRKSRLFRHFRDQWESPLFS